MAIKVVPAPVNDLRHLRACSRDDAQPHALVKLIYVRYDHPVRIGDLPMGLVTHAMLAEGSILHSAAFAIGTVPIEDVSLLPTAARLEQPTHPDPAAAARLV